MAPLKTLLAASLLASTTLALPSKPQKRGFRAQASHNPPSRALTKRSTGETAAEFVGGGWLLHLTIGGQPVTLNIDTGSSNIWTVSTLEPESEVSTVRTPNPPYDPSKSSTYKRIEGQTYAIEYGDGSGSSGIVGSDVVDIGGASVTMPFGLCTKLRYGPGESSRNSDGPVGLGFGQENSAHYADGSRAPTFMEAIQNQVPDPVFATKFTRDASGFVDFGFVDHSQYDGELTVIPIHNDTTTSAGQWFAEQVSFGKGGKPFDNVAPITMDFDVGTSTLNIPAEAARQYFDGVDGADMHDGLWVYVCNTELPDFEFYFAEASGPQKVVIPGSALYYTSYSEATNTCYSWISPLSDSGSQGNAGIPLYLSEYMIFNQAKPELSLGKQSQH